MAENNSDETLYLVDGSGFIFRAYHALPPLTRSDGTPVGAVLGFTNMLVKLLKDIHAPYVAIIFDAARKNFRNDIFPEYKATRPEPPEDLVPQFALIRNATRAFGLPCLELEGYEADDLIAAYTKIARSMGKKVTIVGSDKDLMQLVDKDVQLLDPIKQKTIGIEEVMEKVGVPPEKVTDVQALAGDSIDNIPGVPGIGVKTAAQLIGEYGGLETLLERAGEIKQPKRRQALIDNAESARMSKKLVLLDKDAPLPMAIEDMKTADPASPELVEFLEEMEFRTLLTRVEKNHSGNGKAAEDKALQAPEFPECSENVYALINDEKILKEWLDEAKRKGLLAIDTETTSLTPAKASLCGISIAHTPGMAAYIPVGHCQHETPADLFGEPASEGQECDIRQLSLEKVIRAMKPVLEDPSVLKIGHNIKYDMQMLMKHGVRMSPVEDTMLLSYVLDGSSHGHGMDELAETLCGHSTIKYADVAGKGKAQITFDSVGIEAALPYAAEDADITLRLYHMLKPRLAQEKMSLVYEDIERPLIPVIADMELRGIRVDRQKLKEMSDEFARSLATLEEEIHTLAGHPFNVASPRQIGSVLFDEMGLSGGKKTKTGDWSTTAQLLEKLADQGHDVVRKILDWRQLAKLKSTYTDSLQEQINPDTGRVHTSFSMAGTSTGRLASSEPNLQNIPIRTEEGRKIREAFISEEGWKILSVDYSQIELRLAAEMAEVEGLKQAFQNRQDIHSTTAASVFGLTLEDVTPDLRRKAKEVNFGILYGISPWGLAKRLGIDPEDAKDFISRYFARFPELPQFMEDCKEEARRSGYVRTLFGRKCFVPGIHDKNGAVKSAAERQAINAPLQGTAADIMKLAMIRVAKALEESGLKARMLLQAHDELILEVPDDELEKASELVGREMEAAATLSLPLETEAGWGVNWADAH
jgi:DNA polymerase-1